MPHYMVQFAYTTETWQTLMHKPEDRTPALESLAKQAGGRLLSLYYHAGEYDGVAIFEAPDDASVNAAIFAAQAAGGVRATRTTRLYTPKEMVDALGRAGKIVYQRPGAK